MKNESFYLSQLSIHYWLELNSVFLFLYESSTHTDNTIYRDISLLKLNSTPRDAQHTHTNTPPKSLLKPVHWIFLFLSI